MDTAPGLQEKADVAKVKEDAAVRPCCRLGSRKVGSFSDGFFPDRGFLRLRRAGRGGGPEHDGFRRGVREGGANGTGPHPPPRPGAKAAVTLIMARDTAAEDPR